MGSIRLPGKVLLPAGGRPVLEHQVRRLRAVPSVRRIVLAITVNPADDPLVEFAERVGILCHRGSEDDVMSRVIGAAEAAGAEIVVETTGDCPILDPELVEQTIRMFLSNDCDYASNVHVPSYPIGMDAQVFRLETLRRSSALTRDPRDREHVSWHIRCHPELFRLVTLVAPPELHWPTLGLTLDEHGDLLLLRKLIEHFGEARPLFGCRETLEVLRAHPDWVALNAQVSRKEP